MEHSIMRIDECCVSVSDGDHLPPPKSEIGVPFITISNINPIKNSIDFSDAMYVPREYYESVSNIRKAVPGDILYSVVGSFGIPVLIKEDKEFVFQRHIAILRPDHEVVIPEFLYYIMRSNSFFAQADAYAIGSAQRTLSLGSLRKMKVVIPSLRVQEKIVSILSAYDNLIEVNNKRIKVLEQMAENLYKEWFVRFRFPGHENAEFENGIPKEWNVCRFSSIANVLSGGTPSTEHDEYYGGKIPFYTPKDSMDDYFVFDTISSLTEEGLQHCNSQLYPKNAIMITARGTVGNLNLLARPMAMNQSCYALTSDTIPSQYFLFFLIKREILKLKKMASGGVFDTIIVNTFDHIKVSVPKESLIQEFDKLVSPIMDETYTLLEHNRNLIKQRDLLLPRLMSGKLVVQ